MSKKILILTGPGGAGKTTIAELLVKKHNFLLVDGDNLDTEFFPNGEQWLPKNSRNLEKAHNKILDYTKKLFHEQEKSIVLDYIIFGRYVEFFEKFKKEFGKNLIIKVLFPSLDETVKRDWDRKCWTTGIGRILAVRKELKKIKKYIGKENFINSTKQTPEQTIKQILTL